ncbi:uncharacterized protein LOC125233201 isoform X2 [Leguminivora glycinivorella]|nr:uncharacterized protein LOC125233201 isoform X2 [Leguminivora glycinivorella]
MSYFFGHGASGDSGAEPDLAGISNMLKMVSDLDDTRDNNEPLTLFRSRETDEIRISKLNPNAGVYVPGTGLKYNKNAPKQSPKKSNKTNKIASENKDTSNSDLNGTKQNGLPTFNNMFKSKSVKDKDKEKNDSTCEVKHEPKINNVNMFKSKSGKVEQATESNTNNVQESTENRDINIPKGIPNGFPKTQIETKAEELKELQDKLKSTIIASSTDKSLQTKRQKNVAIATLLKLGVVPDKQPVLIKPDYFKKSLNEKGLDNEVVNVVSEVKDLPSTSSSETNVNYIEQDSISKVNGWFNSMECPKPKPQLQEPLALKDKITFKKKTTSSVTSRNTSTPEPTKDRELKPFKPSNYASELLKKYETNAQREQPLIEDLGTRLERQCKERDEIIRQKMLARQNAG